MPGARGPHVAAPTLALLLVLLGGLAWPAVADESSFRNRCVDVSSARPRPVDPFAALTRQYVTRTFAGAVADDPLGNEAKAAEIGRGALLIMLTHTGRAAKLLASLDGQTLVIHKLVTYDASGETVSRSVPLRLADNSTVDAGRGRVNRPEAESDARWVRTDGGRTLRPLGGARIRLLIAVPVVAHYMKSRDEFFEDNNVEEIVSRGSLARLLAPTGTMNTIWRGSGVFFFVQRVERCTYLLQDFLPNAPGDAMENVPDPADDCLDAFSRINHGYNFDPSPGLDLYVWWSIAVSGLMGYGAPHKVVGTTRQAGAVWLDRQCVDPNVNPLGSCGHALAHEAGHFLGLCHKCLTRLTPTASRDQCGFCLSIPDCGANDGGFLMRDDGRGRQIPADDIRVARAKALERFTGSVRQRSN
ncbi:MAG TPA: hypothetical protein VK548_06745 [Candidatus Acidoferrum sp.]|nr:hypothetical protein [Candidatus Acidoferrum sp.]